MDCYIDLSPLVPICTSPNSFAPHSHFLPNFLHIKVLCKALSLKFLSLSFSPLFCSSVFRFPNLLLFRVHSKLFFFSTSQIKHSLCLFYKLCSLWVTSHFSVSISLKKHNHCLLLESQPTTQEFLHEASAGYLVLVSSMLEFATEYV